MNYLVICIYNDGTIRQFNFDALRPALDKKEELTRLTVRRTLGANVVAGDPKVRSVRLYVELTQ